MCFHGKLIVCYLTCIAEVAKFFADISFASPEIQTFIVSNSYVTISVPISLSLPRIFKKKFCVCVGNFVQTVISTCIFFDTPLLHTAFEYCICFVLCILYSFIKADIQYGAIFFYLPTYMYNVCSYSSESRTSISKQLWRFGSVFLNVFNQYYCFNIWIVLRIKYLHIVTVLGVFPQG